jgi:ATPase family protein associated with various cellular activities (AAA)/AAA+ lid domain-containing protein
MTNSQAAAADVAALLRARNPLLWVTTREEARAERYLIEAASAAGYVARTWDVAQGVADIGGARQQQIGSADPGETLTAISDRAARAVERGLWIMRDLPVWLGGPIGASVLRQLRNLARTLPGTPREGAQAIVILTPSTDIPAELSGHATVIEWPLPDRAEIAAILDAAIETGGDKVTAPSNGERDAAIDAAIGLAGEEAQACYARSLVQLRRIDPAVVAKEKRRVIARERVLEWFDPLPGGLDAVGGLDNLKAWLISRRLAYGQKARAYGLPAPKGALLVGVSGCGKSLTAKAIATAWGVPLLRVDLGALKSKFVGESEGNLRKAFRVIEAIGRCVVWLDEIEKALQGAISGSADGGVSADALGAILSWMQERSGEGFVIATANDVEGLLPELLRKGRFDDIWFVDLPSELEREGVLIATLRTYGRSAEKLDVRAVARVCEGFTGAELAALIPDALFVAFADGEREITTADLIKAAATVVPLSKTAGDKINRLREWAKSRARFANSTVTEISEQKRARMLDL